MSVSALALALALLIAPVPSRRLITGRVPTSRRPPRLLVLPGIAAAGGAVALAAPPGVVAAAAVAAVTAEVRRRRRTRSRKRTAEAAALQGALDVLVGELRVGAHPVAAFGVAAGEVDGVVAVSMRAVAARARMGADVAAGLRSAARQSSLPAHWERLAVCWHLAQTHGLAIATLMRTAQRDIVERERYAARVNAGMAGARTTAALLAGLPVLGVGLGQAIGADPLTFLFSHGGWLLLVGVVLSCLGLLWSDRITGQVAR
ncbi:type II secretion system F family protein [Mycobacterium deserti]|uniref:Type II secretion system F family protein n=1 Tax=Mycobacterium deserti TaxID=2978347 RepID=A0ABT2MKZ0_9MYCO|nr:type II secretion system F family protein [Mycobacterium deserti]MCT7661755.1 type II secretion system F family protein [Mycobacterium deserti]